MDKSIKVGLVAAFRDFKDEEFFKPKRILEEGGVEVAVISDKKGVAIGESGGDVEVNFSLEEAKEVELDGIFFAGGPGALDHLDNDKSYDLLQKAEKEGKLIGAICISPVILAKAGLLKGKKATVWSSPMHKKPIRILEEEGAKFQEKPVVKDGKVITANGPKAAEEFGRKILDSLT